MGILDKRECMMAYTNGGASNRRQTTFAVFSSECILATGGAPIEADAIRMKRRNQVDAFA